MFVIYPWVLGDEGCLNRTPPPCVFARVQFCTCRQFSAHAAAVQSFRTSTGNGDCLGELEETGITPSGVWWFVDSNSDLLHVP